MKAELHAEVLDAIKREYSFKKEDGKWLQQGTCPACSKPELYANAESPWVVRCGRLKMCGREFHVKEEFPDLFTTWSVRAQPRLATNPHAAADDYLKYARGFDLDRIKGWYTQETYHDPKADNGRGAISATVRFPFAATYWERLIDDPDRFGKKKARFAYGGSYMGHWWCPPDLDVLASAAGNATVDLWLVEGIFDAISLHLNGIAAVALGSCNNYPEHGLAKLLTPAGEPDAIARFMANITAGGPQVQNRIRLVWALDSDKAGIAYTFKFIERAKKEGWTCTAAQIPQEGLRKTDWNDLHQRERLKPEHVKDYLHHGALLVAPSPSEKALLIYRQSAGQRTEFDFDFRTRLYWFKLDLEGFDKAMRGLENATHLDDDGKREEALKTSSSIRSIADCKISALYYQRNAVTDESWYYFRIEFPHDGPEVRGTFTSSQLGASAEFSKRLMHLAPGAIFDGTSQMLIRMMRRQLYNIQRVETIDYVGYTKEHKAWLLGDLAVKDGRVHKVNEDDYFNLGKLSIKNLNPAVTLDINAEPQAFTSEWVDLIWKLFGAKGLTVLSFWLGSLFAEQIRGAHKFFPFLEFVGQAGAGKSTLLEFLWKLLGRRDYEGFDPAKATAAARGRYFVQVSNLPVVLIESDRDQQGEKPHVKSFDWDELKTAFNGRSPRARGMATGGNETYEPPFRGAIVISQNSQVSASEAILSRIVHLTVDRSNQTPKTLELATQLENFPMEKVSGFILRAAQAEGQIIKLINERYPVHIMVLEARPGVKTARLVKTHALLLALSEALRKVINITDAQLEAVQQQIYQMAEERQRAISSDHHLVQNFWEAFDYLDGMGEQRPNGTVDARPRLNHSRKPSETIAVNLNEFVEFASLHRQQVPVLAELKAVLKTSKDRRFIDVKPVNSALKTSTDPNDPTKEVGKAVHCWIFQRPVSKPTTKQ